MGCITCKKGYKYQLSRPYVVQIPIKPAKAINTDYIALTKTGKLTVKKS